MRNLLAATCILALGACASKPDSITPVTQTTAAYEDWACQRISLTLIGTETELEQRYAIQESTRTWDTVKTTAGVLFLWPTLFFIKGDGYAAERIGDLKGEKIALERVGTRKQCDMTYGRV